MDPLTLGATALSFLPGIGKLISGGQQIRQAKEIDASNIFTPYQIPGQIGQVTGLARDEFNNGLPGINAAQNRIGATGSKAFNTGVQGASSGGDVLDLATRVQSQEDQAMNSLNAEALQFRSNALGNYMGALNNEAGYQDKAYQINELDPYNRKANLAASLYGAGKTNQYSGLDSFATSALTAAQALALAKKQG